MSQRSKKVEGLIYLERITIHDKETPMFRAKYDNEYHLRICSEVNERTVIMREFIFKTKAEQTNHYMRLRGVLGMDPK